MPPTLEPEVVESVPQEQPTRRRRAQVRYKIRNLPPAVLRELDERLGARNYPSLRELSLWLEREHGQFISVSSLASYRRHELDPMLRAVKLATAQAAEIVRVTDGDEEEMNLALFRLVQTAIFDLLVQLNRTRHLVALMPAAQQRSAANRQTLALNRADNDRLPQVAQSEDGAEAKTLNKVELAAISALGKTVAIVSRAQLDLKRWREQMREKLETKIAATSATVAAAARDGGLSPDAENKIRAALMEIKL